MSLTIATVLLNAAVLVPPPQTTTQTAEKLHPYLQQQMDAALPGERLPAYFVMGERLRYDDFGNTIRRLDKQTRRDMVVKQLQHHMDQTQSELMGLLDELGDREITIVHRNWLGNFVAVEGTPSAILAAAAIDGVSEVWYDYAPPLYEVEDCAPVAPGAPGNGPIDTRADEVWATGITGAGVIWMNSDSGIRASNTSTSVHPGLAGKLWQNPGEVFNNGLDDDGNGKVDDYHGWDFGANNNTIEDNGGHGTSCAGVFVGEDTTNGNTLGNYGPKGVIVEVTSDKEVAWRVDYDDKLLGNNILIDDLYALNRGPG